MSSLPYPTLLEIEKPLLAGAWSRPIIVELERKIQRRPGKLVIATEIESMVESMFEEEECG